MSDLTDFLLARIAEDEAVARDAIEERSQTQFVVPLPPDYADFGFQSWPDVGVPSVLVGPERVLAECEAKRRIVEWHKPMKAPASYSPPCEGCWEDGGEDGAPLYPCRNLKWAALPYAGHPSYREEWKP